MRSIYSVVLTLESVAGVFARVTIRTPFGGTVPHFDLLYLTKIRTSGVRIFVSHLEFFLLQ